MDNRAGEMSVFVRVVESGSFSEAARLLHMTPSTVSKLVARIEARLGVRLVERSTRQLTLTNEGQFYYDRSVELLGQIEDAEQQLAQGGAEPEGVVRVNSSVSFGSAGIEPLLPAFWQAYPKVIVDLTLSDDVVDLYLERADLAFRVGALPDSNLMARKIGTTRRRIVGSPVYLAQGGTPTTPAELLDHNCLGFNFRRSNPVWPMRESGRIVERMVSGTLIANNADTLRRMALFDVGLIRVADYHLRDHIARGELIEVLADSALSEDDEIHAVFKGATHMPARTRVFLDFFVPRLQAFLQGK
ncbi:MAG: LysR family transcriptional regulator [Devosia sp.]|uniref:LysR substrate-binding domain-containing protein n=1 Tax=Devosia sp. TaxID=1871048 RepID=UPI0033964187